MSAGKGDKWRNNFNFRKYWTNFPVLSGCYQTKAIKVEKKNKKIRYVYK